MFSGAGVSFGVALGGTIAPNFVIFGSIFGTVITEPNAKLNGQDLGTATNTDAQTVGFGAGVAYYLQPLNLYLSGEIAAMEFQLRDSDNNDLYSSDTGVGFHGMVGKEWWVSPEWGIGIAGELSVGSMKDKDDSSIKWTATSFLVAFSATYN